MKTVVKIGVGAIVLVLGVSAVAELMGMPIHDATCRLGRCWLVADIRRAFGVPWAGFALAGLDVALILLVLNLYRLR